MRIALIGYGHMGRLIERVAHEEGHAVVATINPREEEVSPARVAIADVCIDFSHPSQVLATVCALAPSGKPIVVGTTGWLSHITEVKKVVEEYQIGFLYSPNFSLGVQLFLKIVEEAATLINHFDEYDVAGMEWHHSRKADAPSGTARALIERLLLKIDRKTAVLTELNDHPVKDNQLQFSSLRCGSNPGMHSVVFDSDVDTISITHQARSKEGFAKGALKAAEWLLNKKGFYTLEDLLET